MTTYRVAKRRQYARIDSRSIDDDRLTFRARGVLAFLLNKPDNWTFSAYSISQCGPEGRDAVRVVIKELEDAGYLVRRRYRVQGKWATESVLYEHPDDADQGGISAPVELAENPQSPGRETSADEPPRILRPCSHRSSFHEELMDTQEENSPDVADATQDADPPRVKKQREHQATAHSVTQDVWARSMPRPTIRGGFVALQSMAERFLVAGWTPEQVTRALMETLTFTDASVTLVLRKRALTRNVSEADLDALWDALPEVQP